MYYGEGLIAIYCLIAANPSVIFTHPTIFFYSPPLQFPTQTLAQYFHKYFDFLLMQVFLQDNSNNLNDKTELDKFLDGCTHYTKLFTISREDQQSCDPIMLQCFNQGRIINNLLLYLSELALVDCLVSTMSSYQHDKDANSNSDVDHAYTSKNYIG